MEKAIVISGQNLLDISMQYFGSPTEAFQIALANNLSITDDLIPGMELNIPELDPQQAQYQQYYKNRKIKPASAIEALEDLITPDGIDYMIIGSTFEVT